jgi:hypothetical protein
MKVRTWHFDAALAALFGVTCAWMLRLSKQHAEAAVLQYGYNVDSGALEGSVAIAFVLPVAVLFGVAAFAGSRKWRVGLYLHWFAVIVTVCPIAYGLRHGF